MTKKNSKSKSSRAGGKSQSRTRKAKRSRAASAKKLAQFKALYMGLSPQAKEPQNFTGNPPDKDGRRR